MDDKELCDFINYAMLSNEDPKKYPNRMDPGESFSYSGTPDGGSCIISDDELIGDAYSFTLQDCDCSDPKNYDFYDKGRF